MLENCIKDTLKTFDDVWRMYEVVLLIRKSIYIRFQYTIHWDKIQILKKFSSDKINATKNALFFLSRAPTHHSFTFKSQFLYELKHMVHFSKTACGIFYFWFHLIFIKLYLFIYLFIFSTKSRLFDFKTS